MTLIFKSGMKRAALALLTCTLAVGSLQAVTVQQLQQKKAQINQVEARKQRALNQLLNQLVEIKLSNPTRYAVLMDWLHLEQQTAILTTLQRMADSTRNARPASTVVMNLQGEVLEMIGDGLAALAPMKQATN